MRLINKISNFITKLSNSTSQNFCLKKNDISLNYTIFDFKNSVIDIKGEVIYDTKTPNVAFLFIKFFDHYDNEIIHNQPSEMFQSNNNYSCYTWLSKGLFDLPASVPENAKRAFIKIKKSNKEQELTLVIKGKIKQTKITPKNSTTNSILHQVYAKYRETNYKLAYLAGYELLKLSPSLKLAKDLKFLINHHGEMTELAKFIDTVNTMEIQGWKNSSRRIKDDLDKMQNGFSFPQKEKCFYQASNNIFYLLHNSLPYNSGGYATRTHGLLKAINHSEFNVCGVSRPGYPTDHKKYISFQLPKPIPTSNNIDNVLYMRCNQKTKKSSLTISEYVEEYSNQIVELAKEKRPAIIHAASNHPNGLAAVLAAKKLGTFSIYEVRGLWEITRLSRQSGWNQTETYKFMAKMEAEACIHADHVFTITHALKKIMIERGVDEKKISVVPNCVNIEDFTPFRKKDTQLLNKLKIQKSDIVIGYIGSIVNYEGLDDLIEAIVLLKNQGISNFKFLLVGDGAYLNHLKDLVKVNKIQDYIIFTGRVPHEEVDNYYSLVDITPFPRKPYLVCEAVSPLKPFEAMACGKAVIVSSCDALTEIVTHNKNGLVFEKGKTQDLAAKLKLLIENSSIRESLSQYGYNWVKENRTWRSSANTVIKVYKELLKQSKK